MSLKVKVTSDFLITKDKEKIAYTLYSKGSKNLIVIAHGFFNSKECVLLKKLKDLLMPEYDVLLFDFRGHGKSSGLFSWTSFEANDLEAVLNFAKPKYEKIGLVGFSYGAAISIGVLSEKKLVDSLVCVSAPIDALKVDIKFWELDWENDIEYNIFTKDGVIGKGIRPGPFWLSKKNPIDVVSKVKTPIFYIHGDKDWVTKYQHSVKLFRKTKSKKKILIIKDGTHAEFLMRKDGKVLVESIKKWFKETLK